MNFLRIKPGHKIKLTSPKGVPERFHVFDEPSIDAVNAALAAQRPLLIRGEPGVGKTQLAEAAAMKLKRAFYPFVVDSRTESRDLLWHFDAVMRLARAQLYATQHKDAATVEKELAVQNFVEPGPLWWAFDWKNAQAASRMGATPLSNFQNDAHKGNGWVVLIDEIDKAESDVPNGLLEALGSVQFTPFGQEKPVNVKGTAPLVIITTNEERVLPDAFVRRCLMLHLLLPTGEEDLITYLQERGQAHFGRRTTAKVLREAARQLVMDREFAKENLLSPLPGQAEYLDLVRAVVGLATKKTEQIDLLSQAARFTLKKHPGMLQRSLEKRS
jgi:MoxR-like ATPase